MKILKKRKLKSEQVKANESMLNALESITEPDTPATEAGVKRKLDEKEESSKKRKKMKKVSSSGSK